MAPLTRNRATKGTDAPNELNARYYRQRATAGLIISEATQISKQGQGYLWTPGIYSEAQAEGWTKVTEACIRQAEKYSSALACRARVACSPYSPAGQSRWRLRHHGEDENLHRNGFHRCFGTARFECGGHRRHVADYKRAAENAKRAGFDGIEIHGANGVISSINF